MVLDGIGRETEELLRYRAELGRRFARAGVQDLGSLVALYQQLRAALQAVSAQEIEWARAKAGRLCDELGTLQQRLASLQALKRRLEG